MAQLDRDVIAPHRQLLNPGENTTLTRASILQSLKSSWLAAFPTDWSDRLQSLGHSTWLLLKRPLIIASGSTRHVPNSFTPGLEPNPLVELRRGIGGLRVQQRQWHLD